MKERLVVLFLVVSLAVLAYAFPSAQERPFYIECVTSRECGKGHCCTIGTERFAMPTCRSYLDKGETCRPSNNQPISTNLTYPDGSLVMFENIYYNFCPCASNLRCSSTATCEDPTDIDFNYLNYN